MNDVITRARNVLDNLDADDYSLPTVEGQGCPGAALVRGGESRRPSSISLDEITERLETGDVSPEDGIGNGFLPLQARHIVNVGVLTHDCLAELHTRGFRIFLVDESGAFLLVLLVPATNSNDTS